MSFVCPLLRSRRTILSCLLLLLAAGLVHGFLIPSAQAADPLTIYSGRSERLIKPVLDAFTATTGIQIELLSSGSTELVNRLKAEGDRTPADLLITNDAGTLELARAAGLLHPLNMREVDRAIPPQFRAPDNAWVGLSGRFWIVVYNRTMVQPDQVKSILDLADPKWKDKIAIPNSGSEYLQAGVSVIRSVHGDEKTRQFLQGLKANAGSQVYQKSSQIVDAVAKGQVAMGIVNHYCTVILLLSQKRQSRS
jgi:iron(III) transport system substrate-binding protein